MRSFYILMALIAIYAVTLDTRMVKPIDMRMQLQRFAGTAKLEWQLIEKEMWERTHNLN